jgi:hypothetical protein
MSPESLVLIAVALGAGAIVKGATGMGLPLIAVPALAASFGVPHALAIMTVPILVTNIWQIWRYRAHIRGISFLRGFIVTGGLGIMTGTWLLTAVPERSLSLALGLLILAYFGLRIAKPDMHLGEAAGRGLAPAVGLVAGTLQGATGISAPIAATYVHAMHLERETHVVAVSAIFLLFAVTQLPALTIAGVLTWERFVEGLFALIPVVTLMPLGTRLLRLMSRKNFDRTILALLLLMAGKLIVDALSA